MQLLRLALSATAPPATREVRVGNVGVGGANPIRVQSMITCDTMDTAASIQQTLDLAAVGCEIVRITAPTVKDAANLQHIVAGLRARGLRRADRRRHPFQARGRDGGGEVGRESAHQSRQLRRLEEIQDRRIHRRRNTPPSSSASASASRRWCSSARSTARAMRIGTNHGSLSDRIMNRYGDTPLGMVESALEFARIARDLGYHDFVFSMKSSNPKVMIEAYRLLVARLAEEGPDWNYPIHLGVTEAGDGEDGRIKSAIGIGSLLQRRHRRHHPRLAHRGQRARNPGARRRSSSVASSPPARRAGRRSARHDPISQRRATTRFSYRRRATAATRRRRACPLGGEEIVARRRSGRRSSTQLAHKLDRLGDYQPEIVLEDAGVVEVDPARRSRRRRAATQRIDPHLVTVPDGLDLPVIAAFRLLAARLARAASDPCSRTRWQPANRRARPTFSPTLLTAATNIGALLCDGIGDAILVQGEEAPGQSLRLAYNILQAAGTRIFKTDYVACPSCGRTLFNLQTTTAHIKAATAHLKGVKIAIMGCIVNGPGEMADADFGYVGGAPGKVNLYVGKQAVKFNIPEAEAVDRLKDLIREHGKWVEPRPSRRCSHFRCGLLFLNRTLGVIGAPEFGYGGSFCPVGIQQADSTIGKPAQGRLRRYLRY